MKSFSIFLSMVLLGLFALHGVFVVSANDHGGHDEYYDNEYDEYDNHMQDHDMNDDNMEDDCDETENCDDDMQDQDMDDNTIESVDDDCDATYDDCEVDDDDNDCDMVGAHCTQGDSTNDNGMNDEMQSDMHDDDMMYGKTKMERQYMKAKMKLKKEAKEMKRKMRRKYKKMILLRFGNHIDGWDTAKLQEVQERVLAMKDKIMNSDNLDDKKKEKLMAILEALEEIIQARLEGSEADALLREVLGLDLVQ